MTIIVSENRLRGFVAFEKKIKDVVESCELVSKRDSNDPTQKIGNFYKKNLLDDTEKIGIRARWFKGVLDESEKGLKEALNNIIETCKKTPKLVSQLTDECTNSEFYNLIRKICYGDRRTDLEGISVNFDVFKNQEDYAIDSYWSEPYVTEDEAKLIAGLFETDEDRQMTYFQANPLDLNIMEAFIKEHNVESLVTGSIDKCVEASSKGATKIAKKGIKLKNGMERNTFDITLVHFPIDVDVNTFMYSSLGDVITDSIRERINQNSAQKVHGYYVVLLPYFALPFARKIINFRMKIEEVYVLNEKGMLVIIAKNAECDLIKQNRDIKLAYTFPERLMEIEEEDMKHKISGEYSFPETIRPNYLDSEDHAINLEEFDFEDIITSHYEVQENIVQLSRPLQEYKLGHLPAVAVLGLGDGVQDETVYPEYYGDTLNPHIYTAKIQKIEVEERNEIEMNEEIVEEIVHKQRAVLSISIRNQDGKNTVLLDTSGNVTETNVSEQNSETE